MNDGGPAFPNRESATTKKTPEGAVMVFCTTGGMSLWDYHAAHSPFTPDIPPPNFTPYMPSVMPFYPTWSPGPSTGDPIPPLWDVQRDWRHGL